MNNKTMTTDEYKTLIEQVNGERPPPMRRGQWAYNTLSQLHQHIATELMDTEYDPFYSDSRTDAFLEHIKTNYVKD